MARDENQRAYGMHAQPICHGGIVVNFAGQIGAAMTPPLRRKLLEAWTRTGYLLAVFRWIERVLQWPR